MEHHQKLRSLVNAVIYLDGLLAEHDDVISTIQVSNLRKGLSSDLGLDEGDLSTTPEELEYTINTSQVVLEWFEDEINSFTNTDSVEEAREILFKIKAALQHYSSEVGRLYIDELLEEDPTPTSIIDSAFSLLEQEND